MNSVSWFLYFSDVVGNLRTLATFAMIATFLMWAVLNISVPVSDGDVLNWPDFKKWWSRGLFSLLICAFVVAVVPSQNTMYAIAASQIGEKIAVNGQVQEIASDATKALQSWIKTQIDPEAERSKR
jgi:hypothetical protein